MKSIFLSFLIFLSFSLKAQVTCPIEIKNANLCAELEWINGPYINRKSHFMLRFWKADNNSSSSVSRNYITPSYKLNVYTWMIMYHGHSHPGPALTLVNKSPGIYEAKDARFFMGGMHGHWEIRIDMTDIEGTLASRSSVRVHLPE